MSKLFIAFSNLRNLLKGSYSIKHVSCGTPLYAYFKREYRKSEFYETSDGNLLLPDNDSIDRKDVFKTVFKEFGKNITSRRVPNDLDDMAYYKAEYPRGNFCETNDGNLLIPTVLEKNAYIKEKVL